MNKAEEKRTLSLMFWGVFLLLFPYSFSLYLGAVQLSFNLTWIVSLLLILIAVFRWREKEDGKRLLFAVLFGLALLLIVPLLYFLIIRNVIPQVNQIAENLLNLILYPETEGDNLSSIFLLLQANYEEIAYASGLQQIAEGGIFFSVVFLLGKFVRKLCSVDERDDRVEKDIRMILIFSSISVIAQMIVLPLTKGLLGQIVVEEEQFFFQSGFTAYMSVFSLLTAFIAIGKIASLIYLIRFLIDIHRLRQKADFCLEGERKE